MDSGQGRGFAGPHLPVVNQQLLAGGGNQILVAAALPDRQADRLLQLAEQATDRGRVHVQPCGGLAQTAVAGERIEVLQSSGVQLTHRYSLRLI